MPRREQVELLLHKASEDEAALDILLASPAPPPAVVGFHAQQAAEKLLKAALRAARVEYPYTHILDYLLRLLAKEGAEIPEGLREVRYLTAFAGRLRYEALDEDLAPTMGLAQMRALIRDLRAWVEAFVEARLGDQPLV